MSAAHNLIEKARSDGVQIIVNGDRVKLTGAPDAVARWAPALRPHKQEIIEAANDARDLTEAQIERAAIREFDGGIDPGIADLLALHGGFDGVDWPGLALTDSQESNLWIVQRPDGLLTVLCTVAPIPKPTSYRQAWPAKFTSPEPAEDAAAPAVQAAQAVIEIARQSCWDCKFLGTHQRPTCERGRPVCWQVAEGRAYPRRFDRLGCGDQTPDSEGRN